MKKSQKNTNKDLKTKKQYQKPRIVHTKVIETFAGSCVTTTVCNPQYS